MNRGCTEDDTGVENMPIPFQPPVAVTGTLGRTISNEISGKPQALNSAEDFQKQLDKMTGASMGSHLLTDFGDIGGGAEFSTMQDMITPSKMQDTKSAMKALKLTDEPEVPKIMELDIDYNAPEEQAQEYSVPRSASQFISEG